MSNTKIVTSLKNDLKKIKEINVNLQDYEFLLETYKSILNKFIPFKEGDKVKIIYTLNHDNVFSMSTEQMMAYCGEVGMVKDVGFNKYSGNFGEFYAYVRFDCNWWFSTLEERWKRSDRPIIYSINPKDLEKVND